MKRWIVPVLATLIPLLTAVSAAAQNWPSKPVRIVVPFGPGSTPDLIARVIAEHLQPRLGQPVLIENKPGASGNTGTDAVAKAEPDGSTIGVSIGGPLAINTLLFSKLPYDPAKDITPITQLLTQPSALVVNANVNARNVAELIALLKREPGKYNYGSIGNGSLSHLAMEAVALASGAHLVHVPYPASPAAVTAIIRGDVHMGALPAISVAPHATAGSLKILAVSTSKRSPYLSEVPTLQESGLDVEADAWNGLIAPARTPEPIIAKIQQAVSEILQMPTVRAKLATQLMEPIGNSPAEFRRRIEAETARWAPVIKAANIRIN